MRTRTTLAAALAAGLLALTACGTGTDAKNAAASPSASPTEATSAPAPEPTPTRQPILKMGTTWEFESTTDGIQGAVTVLSYKQGVKSVASAAEETGTAGYEWAYVELKTCSTKGSFFATTTPWTLAYEDGARAEPSSSTWDDFPKPEYPFETKLTEGKCVRGKLVFPVPGNGWPHTVVYAPEGLDTPQEWAVPAQ